MDYHQLTENERYQIYALKKAGHTQKEIANAIHRHPATASRELRRTVEGEAIVQLKHSALAFIAGNLSASGEIYRCG